MATSLARPQRRQGPALTSRRLLALLDDDRLSREVANGNEAAFEVVYDRHHRGLLSFCRHLLGSPEEAEDALQQTFVSAYDHLTRAGAIERLKPWLYTIARNRCVSMIRARREEPAEEVEPSTDGLQQEVQQRADLMQLLGDLQRLAVDQRAALVLSELKGLSHRDVADILECDTVKVKALVFQARSHLIEYRAARETPCVDVRREIAARRRGAPSGMIRRHVAVCADCAGFRERVRDQRRALALLLPVLPASGLRAKALAASATAGGGGAGSAGSGGAWLVAHSQAMKLAALGAAALAAGAVTVPLLSAGSQPADAGDWPQTAASPALTPLASGGRAASLAAGGRVRAAKHHLRLASHPSRAAHTHAAAPVRRRHRHRTAAAHVRHRPKPQPFHRSDGAGGQGHGHAYAYGHLHAPGWLRHHGGGASSPRRGPHGRGPGRRHR